MTVELFHFSDRPDIAVFAPRPVRIPSERPAGLEWLNEPLVWAIDRPHSILYLFPRDCPRIVGWATEGTTKVDRQRWIGSDASAVAWVEEKWLARIQAARLYRYAFSPDAFEPLEDVGMWVSRREVRPDRRDVLNDLPAELAAAGVELRVLPDLTSIRPIWDSTLHASGVRLRNAAGWER